MRGAEQKKSNCKSCAIGIRTRTPEHRKKCSERVSGKYNPNFGKTGDLNPFYGKRHTKETINFLKNRPKRIMPNSEKANLSKLYSGSGNHMFGKSVYSVWLAKYGKDIADKKLESLKIKQSELNSGSNNSMFGKPSPNGCGNGWKGWFDDKHFRSLRELMILIDFDEKQIKFESGEQKAYKVSFIDRAGKHRNYFPDYILPDSKEIIEVKPQKLWDSPLIKAKADAATIFAASIGFSYILKDPLIESDKIRKFRARIKFYPKYEVKVSEWLALHK